MICDRFIFLFIITILTSFVGNARAVEAKAFDLISQVVAVNSIQIAEKSIPIKIDRSSNSDRQLEQSNERPTAFSRQDLLEAILAKSDGTYALAYEVGQINPTTNQSNFTNLVDFRLLKNAMQSESFKVSYMSAPSVETWYINSVTEAIRDNTGGESKSLARFVADTDDNSTNSTAEEPFAIDKRLGLVAIAVVFSISIILLKFMFVPPTSKISSMATSGVKTKDPKAIETGDSDLVDTLDSLGDLENILKPIKNLLDPVMSSNSERYVTEKTVAKFKTTSQPAVLNSNNTKIDVVVELIKYLQQPDEDLRREAILELAQIADSRGIEPLREILPLVNSTDRSLVLKAIAQIVKRSLQSVENLLFSSLNDANPKIKQSAIEDLTVVYSFVAPITKQLARMQVDTDMQVRQTAKTAIEQLNLCYFPCLFEDCPGNAKYNSNSDGKKIYRIK